MKTEMRVASKLSFALALWGLIGAGSARAELIAQGGFEAGTDSDAHAWNEIEVAGGSAGATSTADRVEESPHSGDFSMLLQVAGADDFGPVAEIQQQSPVGSITPGTAYDFSFRARGLPGPGSVAIYEVTWFDGDNSNGGGPQASATDLQKFELKATYTPHQSLNLVAPAGADSVLIAIRLSTGAFDGATGTAYIDDVSLVKAASPRAKD